MHDLRQELAAPRDRGPRGHARREPAHDRELGRLPRGPRPRGRLRRRALLRRLHGPTATTPSRPCARRAEAGARDPGPVRHERRDADRRARPDRRRRRVALEADADAPAVTWASTPTTTPTCAVANSMAAVRRASVTSRRTINGYGERCGNANMVSDPGQPRAQDRTSDARPAGGGAITGLTDAVALRGRDRQPRTRTTTSPTSGRVAFAHKGGVHGAAVAKVERSYQHVEPARRRQRRAPRRLASWAARRTPPIRGRAARAIELDGDLDPTELSRLIKQLEAEGLAFEGAEASFELLIRRHAAGLRGAVPASWTSRSSSSSATASSCVAEATVKVEVAGEILHTAADGNGPVNALDARAAQGARRVLPGARRASTWSTTRSASSTGRRRRRRARA